jgi:hypothetical protein
VLHRACDHVERPELLARVGEVDVAFELLGDDADRDRFAIGGGRQAS